MLFNSSQFALFLPIVVLSYFICPHRFRWLLLLLASYYFYACWKVEYLVLIVFSTLVDYLVALRLASAQGRARKALLAVSLIANLGMLFGFKYLNFFSASLREALAPYNLLQDLPIFHILLPVGISFYTFQTLSYTIDIYKGQQQPERHFGLFSLYVSFFPQLVAGPIERSTHLLPQFRQEHLWDFARFKSGAGLLFWGFFKKIVVADNAAIWVNQIYGAPESHSGGALLLGTYLFAFQIFCDFSGYSDIAIGSARMMGFDIMQNFSRPYFSKSIGEFWRRWHISLSTWFRDYVYIPLGGNRVSTARRYGNLMIVFTLSGLWHGANWTFIVWGVLHGLYLVVGSATQPLRDRVWSVIDRLRPGRGFPLLRQGLQVLVCFHLVLLAWVFFRATSLTQAFYILNGIFTDLRFNYSEVGNPYNLLVTLAAIGFMEFIHFTTRAGDVVQVIDQRPAFLRWSFYYALILAILVLGEFGNQEFIYFQF